MTAIGDALPFSPLALELVACFLVAASGVPGLWLDQRSPDCPPDPFENEQKYPGVASGARGKTIPTGSYYGYATGVVGLRLFPNPAFDEQAARLVDHEGQ